MGKCFRISSNIRKPFLIYDFATAPLWISLYMRKVFILFFISVYSYLLLLHCLLQAEVVVKPEAISKPQYVHLLHPLHCKQDPIHVFPVMKLRGLLPNFHVHVSVSDLCIPTIVPPISLRPRIFIFGNICIKFSQSASEWGHCEGLNLLSTPWMFAKKLMFTLQFYWS